jgi:hypothetical protein
VHSEDPYGNHASDDNGGSYYHFETLGDLGAGLQPCHAGQVTVEAEIYSCSDTMTFRVIDLDLNGDPLVADTATLFVSSTTEPDPEPVLVTETEPNSSWFAGSISLAQGSPASDGVLQVGDDDTLTVTYHDADDGTGLAAVSFDTAVTDCAGPEITQLRITEITDNRFNVTWQTSEPATSVVEWGLTPALGQTVSQGSLVTGHSIALNQFDICTEAYVRVRGTDAYGNESTADLAGQPYAALTYDIPGLYYRDTFEDASGGWTLTGEWEIGEPQGLGGSSGPADPAAAYNNSGVLGHDLSGLGSHAGDYEPETREIAQSPTFDATSWVNTKLIFYRRLNTHSSDEASLWMHTAGGRPLYRSEGTVSQSSFSLVSADLAQGVDGEPSVRFEFHQQADAATEYSGWNIDDFILKDGSLPDYGACGGCQSAPSFAGVVSALDNDACGEAGVTVSWNDAFSWGSGAGGTFAVYRDTSPGFTPSGANLLASGIAGLSYVDGTAPLAEPVYYLVRAENDESCGSGPNNGGLTDGDAVYAPATDTNVQPIPGAITDLMVRLVNGAHVRLEWTAPENAARYNAYRSTDPQPGGFLPLGETQETFLDDEASGANANTYFYLVHGANTCGQEGP